MKQKFYYQLLILLLVLSSSFAQPTFQKTYGNINGLVLGSDIQRTFDGGYILAGSDNTQGSNRGCILAKTSSNGTIEWSKHFGISGSEGARSVKQTADSGYIFTGYAPDIGDDMLVIKTDATGNIIWSKAYGGNDTQEGETILATSDGGYLITGEDFNQSLKAFIVKTDANGDTLWTRTGDSAPNSVRAYSTIETTDGGYIFTGYYEGPGQDNYYLVKLNSSGDTVWTKGYNAGSTAQARCVKQLNDNGFIVCGKIHAPGQDNIFLLRTDSIGNVLWAKTYGDIANENAYDIKETNDLGFIISGETSSFGSGMQDGYIIKTDSTGLVEWSRTYGGAAWDRIQKVLPASDGGYMMNGFTSSFPVTASKGYFLKTDSVGESGCNSALATTTAGTVSITIINGFNVVSTGCTVTTLSLNAIGTLAFTTLCTTVGIDNSEKFNTDLIVEPNPFQNYFNVLLNDKDAHIILYDIAGNIILEKKTSETRIVINTQILKPGMYVLKATTGKETLCRKVVKY